MRSRKAAVLGEKRVPQGVNTHLAGVKAFFRWAVAEQRLTCNPTLDVRGARNPRRKPRKRDAAILHLMAYTGLRTIEVQMARLGDLHQRALGPGSVRQGPR